MKQSFGTGTRALSSALALSLAVNVWPVTPVVVMAEEPAGPTVLQGILQGPEDESEPSEAPVIVEQAVPDDGVHGEEGGGYGQPGGGGRGRTV